MTTNISKEIWQVMIDHLIGQYPEEGCGILAGPVGKSVGSRFYPCKNSYDELHARDPKAYPRTSRTAYLISGREQQEVFARVAQEGMVVKAIIHSHTDHDAYLSEEDRTMAAPWGEPFYPEISYIVISVWKGQFKEAREFVWNQEKGDFGLLCIKPN